VQVLIYRYYSRHLALLAVQIGENITVRCGQRDLRDMTVCPMPKLWLPCGQHPNCLFRRLVEKFAFFWSNCGVGFEDDKAAANLLMQRLNEAEGALRDLTHLCNPRKSVRAGWLWEIRHPIEI